jgi:hypothetical protein
MIVRVPPKMVPLRHTMGKPQVIKGFAKFGTVLVYK